MMLNTDHMISLTFDIKIKKRAKSQKEDVGRSEKLLIYYHGLKVFFYRERAESLINVAGKLCHIT